MRTRVVLAGILLVALVGGGAAVLVGVTGEDGRLERTWLSDTGVPVSGNHHAVAAGQVDGEGLVLAPISGEHDTGQCRLAALEATDGSVRWDHGIPAEYCWIHSVGTPSLADYDGDGTPEVIAPTAEERLLAFGPDAGDRELDVELSAYGYSEAAVGPLLEDGGRALAAVDAEGTVFVVRPDGSTAWTYEAGSYVWAGPAVANVTGDDRPELVVGFGDGNVTAFGVGGSIAWSRSLPGNGSLTWTTVVPGTAGGDATVFAATEAGGVYALEGTDGNLRWERDLGRLAAVGPAIDGDGDGDAEVYATARDATLRALDAETGEVEWETKLTDGDVQMTPPPAAGDVDGDGEAELVVTTNDGAVSVVDPGNGTVLATETRTRPFWEGGGPVSVWVDATLSDVDGDGAEEIYVMYGDGRVARFDYGGS